MVSAGRIGRGRRVRLRGGEWGFVRGGDVAHWGCVSSSSSSEEEGEGEDDVEAVSEVVIVS